jgi:succinyl-CoA synthetase alpha subunit
MRALRAGLHVLLFSDNVPVETEVRLKRFARSRRLLMMGPDCGTAILSGTPLGFANAVSRGPIGIVAASGTGLQEVSCIVSNEGSGISQAIGTGGRDLRREVGGIMFVEGIRALAADRETKVIVLIAKRPDPDVLRKVRFSLRGVRKPVVPLFLGSEGQGPSTLDEASRVALAIVRGGSAGRRRGCAPTEASLPAAIGAGSRRRGRGRYLRGLFSGGTFCTEAQVLLRRTLERLHSNVPIERVRRLRDPWKSMGHTLVDLGDDVFTAGRPHPMIDYAIRKKRIREEARDPETAAILLDVVLGFGSHPDPASELAGPIAEAARRVAVLCSITGTDRDPQDRREVERRLREAGARVFRSNAEASLAAREIVRGRS